MTLPNPVQNVRRLGPPATPGERSTICVTSINMLQCDAIRRDLQLAIAARQQPGQRDAAYWIALELKGAALAYKAQRY